MVRSTAIDEASAAEDAAQPMAPIQVKRRHQIPRSRSGQNVEAAMAKAHPTSTLMEMLRTARPRAVITMPMAMAEARNALTPPPMMSCESAPGHADQQARRGREEGGEGPGGDERPEEVRRGCPPP